MKVNITSKYLKELATTAIEGRTTEAWMSIAVEWMEQAEKEIDRLTVLLAKERNEI